MGYCEEIWKEASITGKKSWFDKNPNINFQNHCAACSYVYNKYSIRKCNGFCIIKWGKLWDDDFPTKTYNCEQMVDSPYREWKYCFEEQSKEFAKKVLECIKESKRYYRILFKKF